MFALCMFAYGVFVHEAPDSSCNLTGEQDDQAGEELQEEQKHQIRIWLTDVLLG